MSDRYCTKCGTAGDADQNFCARCGAALPSEGRPDANAAPHEDGPEPREPAVSQQLSVEPAADVPLPTPPGPSTKPQRAKPASPRRRTSRPAPNLEPVTPEPTEQDDGPLELHVRGRTQPIVIPPDGSLTIGSDQICDVVVDEDPYVSAQHARIARDAQGLLLTDADSTNGTFVRVTRPTRIEIGDEIRIGTTVLRVDSRSPQA